MSAKPHVIDGQLFFRVDGKTLPPDEAIEMLKAEVVRKEVDLRAARTVEAGALSEYRRALAAGDEPDRERVRDTFENAKKAQTAVEAARASIQRVRDEWSSHFAAQRVADLEGHVGRILERLPIPEDA